MVSCLSLCGLSAIKNNVLKYPSSLCCSQPGAELLNILKTKINKEQAIRLVKLVVDFMQDNLDADTLSSLRKEVPAVRAITSGSEGKAKED